MRDTLARWAGRCIRVAPGTPPRRDRLLPRGAARGRLHQLATTRGARRRLRRPRGRSRRHCSASRTAWTGGRQARCREQAASASCCPSGRGSARLRGGEVGPRGGSMLGVRRRARHRREPTPGALVCEQRRSQVARYELDARGTLTDGRPIRGRRLDLPDWDRLEQRRAALARGEQPQHALGPCLRPRSCAARRGTRRHPRAFHCPRAPTSRPTSAGCSCGGRSARLACTCSRPPPTAGTGAACPAATVYAMDEPTFVRGRRNPAEGGPQGIDLDLATQILLVTREERPFARFDVAEVLERPSASASMGRCAAAPRLRRWLPRERNARQPQAAAELAAVLATKAWRSTAPARRL